jgi:hypothetical protein
MTDEPLAPPPGWRFRLGVILIAVSIVSPLGVLLVPLSNLTTAMKATLTGLLIAGVPEILTVLAVAVMGKAGFTYVKNRIVAVIRPALGRLAPAREVGPTRYYIGLTMLIIPGIYGWILSYSPPEVIPGFPDYRIHMGLAVDLIFISSFFVLGGEFWDKLRALFIHKARAQLPES